LYPTDLTREIQLFFGAFVILVNLGIYALVYYRDKKNSKHQGHV